jgi:hypothetical protein
MDLLAGGVKMKSGVLPPGDIGMPVEIETKDTLVVMTDVKRAGDGLDIQTGVPTPKHSSCPVELETDGTSEVRIDV